MSLREEGSPLLCPQSNLSELVKGDAPHSEPRSAIYSPLLSIWKVPRLWTSFKFCLTALAELQGRIRYPSALTLSVVKLTPEAFMLRTKTLLDHTHCSRRRKVPVNPTSWASVGALTCAAPLLRLFSYDLCPGRQAEAATERPPRWEEPTSAPPVCLKETEKARFHRVTQCLCCTPDPEAETCLTG